MNAILEQVAPAWDALEEIIHIGRIKDEDHYDEMLALMDSLLEEVGEDETHHMAGLLHVVGDLIREFDEDHHEIPEATGADLVRFLMDQNGLRQSDLPEIGTQGVVSEVLRGRRIMNLRQTYELSVRFRLPMECFVAK